MRLNKIKRAKISIIFSILFVILLLKLYLNKNLLIVEKDDECNQEWEMLLANKCYFRKNIAYYYTDLNKIRLGQQRHVNFNNNKYKLLVQVTTNTKMVYNYNLTEIKIIQVDQYKSYIFEYIEADLNVIKNVINIKVKISSILEQITTQNSINLIIKKFNHQNKENTQQENSIICGKISYFSNDYIKNLEYWIKMNKLIGYDKILIFNHSIGTNFNDLFSRYKGFLDIIPFKCIPNLLNNKNHYQTIKDMEKTNKYIEYIKYTMHYQKITLNECFLMNKDKYKYIAIFDTDELILPIRKNESKLIPYIQDIVLKSNELDHVTSLTFKMSNYLQNETMNKIFFQIEKMINLNLKRCKINLNQIFTYDEKFSANKISENSYLLIENDQDYNYAVHLYNKNKDFVEPLLKKNNSKLLSNDLPDLFNRFYYFTCDYTTNNEFSVKSIDKTIYNTLYYNDIVKGTLYGTISNNSIIVAKEYGHLSHFRETYKRPFSNCSIQEIKFDFNYLNSLI